MSKKTNEIKGPAWCKLFVPELTLRLGLDYFQELTEQQREEIINAIGSAFVNGMFYFLKYCGEGYDYEPKSRDERILYDSMVRSTIEAFKGYQKAVESGREGGLQKAANAKRRKKATKKQ